MAENSESKTPEDKVSEASLLAAMDEAWRDHFQTRTQTWETLKIVAALAAGLVAADWQFKTAWATGIVGLAVALAGLIGILITYRHRNTVEIRKFTHIVNIEERLLLHGKDLLADCKVPGKISWFDLFRIFDRNNTSLFIARMHLAFIVFAVAFTLCRVITHAKPN